MKQYIDKSSLVAEIKKLEKMYCYDNKTNSGLVAISVFENINNVINTLEVKEVNEVPANVMLNQFGNKYISSWSGLKEYDNFQVNEEIKILIPNK